MGRIITFRNIFGFLIGPCVLPIPARQGVALRRSLVAIALVVATQGAFAGDGANTNFPFSDDFEAYTNDTPLNTGTNGWYASATNVVVVSNMTIGATGTNSAMIPVDCTLSNRFANMVVTNVWMQMYLRPRLYDVTNNPVVDTNQAGMFYVNSNGNFVVHNGPTADPTNSTKWVILTNVGIGTNGTNWVTIGIYEDFIRKKWDLYASGVLVTNNIDFINTSLTSFAGFDVYNGASTSYLDDVWVIASNRAAQTITFSAIPAQPLTNVTMTLSATASSGLPVTFTLISGSGSIVGNVLTFSSADEKTIEASQPGNANYFPAEAIINIFPVYGYTPWINTIPYTNTFEQYFNLEPLINGTNGWYGDSSAIIAQSNTVLAGSRAAMIPVDCMLSNRFVSATTTNVWIQMDVRPSLFDGTTNTPVVDTNLAWMFYINSNGNFVVHNGPATNTSPTNSLNWVTLTNGAINTNGTTWVTIGIYEDFTRKKWDLYTNGVLVTNNIKFINPALTNFVGFDVYNGGETSYMDYVSVSVSNRTAGYIGLGATTLTYTATYLVSPADQTVAMTNLGQSAFTYSNTADAAWLTVTPVVGELAGGATQILTCAVNSAALTAGVYVATNTISSPNADATNAPQTIVVTLTVGKATATVNLTDFTQTYNGTARNVTTSTVPAGLVLDLTYDGNAWAPTNAGSYAVTGVVNDLNYQGTGTVTLTVNKAPLAATLVPTISKVYDGNTVATLGFTNFALSGLMLSETSSVNQTVGAYSNANVGTSIRVTATLASTNFPEGVGGFLTNNYILPTGATGDVGAITTAGQTITFPAIPAQPYTNGSLTLSATASSWLLVSFTVISGPGTNAGNVLTFTNVGYISIAASQAGDANWNPAPTLTNSFFIYGFSPSTSTIPYTNNFENYLEYEPLVGGTNGWYGSSTEIIVQTNIVATGIYITATGTKAAKIPMDCALSNRFVAGTPLNVRMEMDSRLVRSDLDATNFPPVDTNIVAQFYVDTNGHFVVCNGLGTTSIWCMVSNAVGGSEFVVTNDTWAHIVVYLNYRQRNWKLKANNVLITNKIGFVTQQTNGFRGFDVFSGNTSTSYLDNVSVNWWDRFKINGVLDHLIRFVNGIIPDRINGLPTP